MATETERGREDDFDTLAFERRLARLKDTQEGITALSTWCLHKREHHKKIVTSWLNVLKRARVEQRLTLFYLANDVIQYSKRKNYEFVESWGTTLQRATPLVRDDKVKHRILRIFRIWEERQIYDEEFLTDLTGLLSVTAGKPTPDFDPNDFQVAQLVNKIRQCSALEADTDRQLKRIHECALSLNDPEALRSALGERRDGESAKRDLDDGVVRLQGYVRSLEKELVARAALCRLLQKANRHYATQRGEVKLVANAYKNFGSRVRGLKRKLDELSRTLPSGTNSPVPSPPSPGEAVPSPGPDEDLELPSSGPDANISDGLFSDSLGSGLVGKGFASFVGSDEFSFESIRRDLSGKRADDGEENARRPRSSPPPPPSPSPLPGLDLLTRNDVTDTSSLFGFYGETDPNDATDTGTNSDGYANENNRGSRWTNAWEIQRMLSSDTPESPPAERLRSPPLPPPIIPIPPPIPDVDHRRLLLAPPPMPRALSQNDDIDHRQLPPLPPSHPPPLQNERNRQTHNDVDHRNLISLTMGSIPPPPIPPISPWTPQNSRSDRDYRGASEDFSSIPPPLPLMSIPPPRRMTSHNDNVESIDMEMSDDESLDHEDEYNRHLRIENSMARIHGQPPPMSHNQPPNMFRKQEPNIREKPFLNNNRHLGAMHSDKHGNNLHHNEKPFSRTNLVRINSSDVECENDKNGDFVRENFRNSERPNVPDIFNDFQPNAMNPVNPNCQTTSDSYKDSDFMNEMNSDKKHDETDAWQRRSHHMNPMTPNAGRNRPMFHQRPPSATFRRPPPLLSTPSHIDDSYFNSPHNQNRGGGNFRRSWGHSRPPRRGKW